MLTTTLNDREIRQRDPLFWMLLWRHRYGLWVNTERWTLSVKVILWKEEDGAVLYSGRVVNKKFIIETFVCFLPRIFPYTDRRLLTLKTSWIVKLRCEDPWSQEVRKRVETKKLDKKSYLVYKNNHRSKFKMSVTMKQCQSIIYGLKSYCIQLNKHS